MLMSTHGILMGVIAKLIHMCTVLLHFPVLGKLLLMANMWVNNIVCGFFGTSNHEGLKAVCSWLINSSSLNMWPLSLLTASMVGFRCMVVVVASAENPQPPYAA